MDDDRLLSPKPLDPCDGVESDGTPEEIEAAWSAEIKRRREDIQSGRCVAIPGEEVLREGRMMIERAREQRRSDSTTSRYTPTMGAEALRLYEAAMQLSDRDRMELAAALADSVSDKASEGEVLASWIAEVRRRIEDSRAGRSKTIPFEEVDAELEALIAKTEALRIREAAVQLPDTDRMELVAILLEGLDKRPTQEEIDASWVAEAKRRLEDIRSGRMATVPYQEAIREARAAIEQAKQARTN
jgi:putative addiction module component (TIGR02574 family)